METVNKKDPAVSIIMPVYNVEKYLEKALESAACQTMKNYEVIIVNDGSTDSSLDIIVKFTEKYDNFKLINKENGGLSSARNKGLEYAKGEYVVFLDSDDFLQPTYLEEMYEACIKNNAQIAYCAHYIYYYDRKIKFYMPFTQTKKILNKKRALNLLIRDITMHYFAWNKFYKKSLFTDNNIKFHDMYFEDIATTPQLFYFADKIAVLSKALYNYTKRPGSILNSMNVTKLNDYIKAYAIVRNFLEINNAFADYKFSFLIYGYRMMMCDYYSVLRIHILSKNFKGFFDNINNSNRSISYYKSDKFQTFEGEPILPYPIKVPEDKSKNV